MAKKFHTGGLGRGLSALIDDAGNKQEVQVPEEEGSPLVSIREINIADIVRNPYQPRTEFSEDKIDELAASIKLLGVIQPITVTRLSSGKYQIISGERRFRASSRAGLETIPAYIKDVSEGGMLEMALVENIQREDLDPVDIALSFQRLIEECSLTQDALSQRVGKNRATVANYLRLLKLPPEIQFAIKAKKISMGHAKALLAADNSEVQLKLANKIIEDDLSVRQIEEKVRKMNAPEEENGKKKIQVPENGKQVAGILSKYFDNKVTVKPGKKGSGVLSIHYKSDAQLDEFLRQLREHNL